MFITTRSNEVVRCRPTRPAVQVIFSCVTLGRRILSPAPEHFVFGLRLVLGLWLVRGLVLASHISKYDTTNRRSSHDHKLSTTKVPERMTKFVDCRL